MARDSTSQALREIRALYALGPIGEVSDAQLIGRFLDRGDDAEEAFAALVQRHGPMVLGVCRRFGRDRHEAEDQSRPLDSRRGAAQLTPRFIKAEANLLRLPLFALSTKGLRTLDGIECRDTIRRARRSRGGRTAR